MITANANIAIENAIYVTVVSMGTRKTLRISEQCLELCPGYHGLHAFHGSLVCAPNHSPLAELSHDAQDCSSLGKLPHTLEDVDLHGAHMHTRQDRRACRDMQVGNIAMSHADCKVAAWAYHIYVGVHS